MNRLWIQLKLSIIMLAIPVLILTGCVANKQQTKIPAEEIQKRANRSFDDLSAHETGQRRPLSSKEKRNEDVTQQPEVKSIPAFLLYDRGWLCPRPPNC